MSGAPPPLVAAPPVGADGRSPTVVVLNPGSAYLRIGTAAQAAPMTLPHCVAHRTCTENGIEWRGAGPWDVPPPDLESGREEAYRALEAELKLGPHAVQQPRTRKQAGAAPAPVPQMPPPRAVFCELVPADQEDYAWTTLTERAPPKPVKLETPTGEGEAAPDSMDIDAGPRLMVEPGPGRGVAGAAASMQPRAHLFGEEALRLGAQDPYTVRWPMRGGRLNVSETYPLRQVVDDLAAIWGWAIKERLGLNAAARGAAVCVLVLPDHLAHREVRELLHIALVDLGFQAAIAHQESLAATFGHGAATALVVNLGAQVTTVACVEEGALLPATRCLLPYGGQHLALALAWVLERSRAWPLEPAASGSDPRFLWQLESLKEAGLRMPYVAAAGGLTLTPPGATADGAGDDGEAAAPGGEGGGGAGGDVTGDERVLTLHYRERGQPTQRAGIMLGYASLVTPVGLFYPRLLAAPRLLKDVTPSEPLLTEHEDSLDERYLDETNPARILAAAGVAGYGPPAAGPGPGLGGVPGYGMSEPVGLSAAEHSAAMASAANSGLHPNMITTPQFVAAITAAVQMMRGRRLQPGDMPPQAVSAATNAALMAGSSMSMATVMAQPAAAAAIAALLGATPGSPRGDPGGGSAAGAKESPGQLIGLDQAIMRSLIAVGADRAELKKKLAQNILLIGGGALLPHLVDVLEDRIVAQIPDSEVVETVEVMPRKEHVDPRHTAWKGGALLGMLDPAREQWPQRADWLAGGARGGHRKRPREYSNSITLAAQMLWYWAE